jgi:hypothetical protein
MRIEHPLYTIWRKDWRARRWPLCAMAGIITLLCVATLKHQGAGWGFFVVPAVFAVFASMILSVLFFSAEEYAPTRGYLDTLPISRWRIIAVKILTLAAQNLALLALLLIGGVVGWCKLCFYDYTPHTGTMTLGIALVFILTFCILLIALPLGAIVSLHISSPVVALVITALIGILLMALVGFSEASSIFTDISDTPKQVEQIFSSGIVSMILSRSIITCVVLTGWLFFLYCRTRVREVRPGSNMLLALLFGVGAIEVMATIFYTGWRDLLRIVLGV